MSAGIIKVGLGCLNWANAYITKAAKQTLSNKLDTGAQYTTRPLCESGMLVLNLEPLSRRMHVKPGGSASDGWQYL